MHYFRFMRNGTYDTLRSEMRKKYQRTKRYRVQNPAGYQKLNEPAHPLVNSDGYVYEHRFVYYNKVSNTVDSCALCGEPITWGNCHIDHMDGDVTNNAVENLRALCRPCNVFRGHTPDSMGRYSATIDGKTMSAEAWSRVPAVNVTGSTIRRRLQMGYSDYDAVYGEKKTHLAKVSDSTERKYDRIRGIT
jgi:hypothetical protein